MPPFLRFEQAIYPLWRRKLPAILQAAAQPLLSKWYPVYADLQAPQTPAQMARFLLDWNLLQGADLQSIVSALESVNARIEEVSLDTPARTYEGGGVRLPAQWEPGEKVLLSWGRMYPTIWPMHAEIIEAVSAVAIAEIIVPSRIWAQAVVVYLQERGNAKMANLRLLVLPTDDIWIRDYGPIIGFSPEGQRIAINPTYAVLPQYPQVEDNQMPERWAAHYQIPVQALDLHTEGGNLWSDGQGTLLMSSQIFYSNPYHTRDTLLDYLHTVLEFEKLIITPRLTMEVTGHIDLLMKLADEETLFISAATSQSTAEVLRKAKRLFQREKNAKGQHYRVLELPTPSLYLNWLTHQIRRAYTNTLTINGRMLVPVYEIPEDDLALRMYEDHLPDYEIIPINSRLGINGGGAVHCMTKEIPVGVGAK